VPVITHAEAYLVDLAVETVRTGAVRQFVKQETIFVEIRTDDGGDPGRVEAVWRELFLATNATTVGARTSLAPAAVDTALWDWCYLEHIPQLRAITRAGIEVVDGHALALTAPGLGIDGDRDAIDDRRVR
jgi:hypothetical protein